MTADPKLHRLALDALEAFGHPGARPQFLGAGHNMVYRVEAEGRRFALRLHTAGDRTIREISSEAAWLDHLGHRTTQALPRPVRSRAGEWVVALPDHSGTPLASTLLTWVQGSPLAGPLNVTQAAQAGQLLATLHVEAERFSPPEGFERPTYDLAYFQCCWDTLQGVLGPDTLPTAQVAVIDAGLSAMARVLPPVQDMPGGFGLIHGDPHPGNLLEHEGHLRLIDFGRLGWGPFLLDVAGAELDLEWPERAAFMGAYTRVRPVPGDFTLVLKALRYLAAIENLAFLAPRPGELAFVLEALPTVVGAVAKWTAEVTR